LKYPGNLLWDNEAAKDHGLMGLNSWFAQHEYKTTCQEDGSSYPGRMVLEWAKEGEVPTYILRRDTGNNCAGSVGEVWTPRKCKASGEPGECIKMPVGKWFYDEFYVSYPNNGVGGVLQYAINKKVIFNYTFTGSEHLPTKPNRVKLTPGYLNAINVDVWADDLEVLDYVPCATFPCGPPTHVPD
jgi:hypothetical protein